MITTSIIIKEHEVFTQWGKYPKKIPHYAKPQWQKVYCHVQIFTKYKILHVHCSSPQCTVQGPGTLLCSLGVKVKNMKMDFNIYGTWHRAFCHCKNHCEDGRFFTQYYTGWLNDLYEKKNHKFSSLVFIARPNPKCLQC